MYFKAINKGVKSRYFCFFFCQGFLAPRCELLIKRIRPREIKHKQVKRVQTSFTIHDRHYISYLKLILSKGSYHCWEWSWKCKYNGIRYKKTYFIVVILFLNSFLLLYETSTRIEDRHHQDKTNIDRKITRQLVNETCTYYMVLIQFEMVGHLYRRINFSSEN